MRLGVPNRIEFGIRIRLSNSRRFGFQRFDRIDDIDFRYKSIYFRYKTIEIDRFRYIFDLNRTIFDINSIF